MFRGGSSEDRGPRKRRVLIVDDDVALARALARLVSAYGAIVHVSSSCREASEVAERFDLAVLDIELRDGSGVDLARALLDSARVKNVVFCTGGTTRAEMNAARALGPVVIKSRGPASLLPLLDRYGIAPPSGGDAGEGD